MALTETQLAAWAGSSTSTRTNTITSASFTPAAGSLVVVVTGCGNVGGVTVTGITVSDSVSGSWTSLAHLTGGGQFADASVWVKDAGSSPSSQTVTVTMAPSTVQDVGLAVRQFTGALPAAGQTGVHATASGAIATVNITPGTTGSQVVGAWGNADTANVTANGSTTFYGQTSDASGAQEGAFEANALSTAGVQLTLGYTASQGGSGLAVAEILPAPAAAAPAVIVMPPAPWRNRYRPYPRLHLPLPAPSAVAAVADSDASGVTADGGELVAVVPAAGVGLPAVPGLAVPGGDVPGQPSSLAVPESARGGDGGEFLVRQDWPASAARPSRTWREQFGHLNDKTVIPVFAPASVVFVAGADASASADDARVFPQPAILILPAVS